MGEIIHVQLGPLANRFGTGYWEMIAGEHGLDETGGGSAVGRTRVSFNELQNGQHRARAVSRGL